MNNFSEPCFTPPTFDGAGSKHRYFIEVSYKGTAYAGFQIQQNANTIQAEVEKALRILLTPGEGVGVRLTGSSRTDAGVHALQNFFHFDLENPKSEVDWKKIIYSLNAILPHDIVAIRILAVEPNAHCRFDAISRTYKSVSYTHLTLPTKRIV